MQGTKENSVREAWILCLILGLIMINFPFVHIFSTERMIFGIPELVLYFFIGWPASIVVIWLFVCNMKSSLNENSDQDNNQG